ncbi:MAG: hypothetical protein HC780_12940 [Leptolyngbyaceae cyanobacterium CSU_1_3]|nr:hypothetical protein [Leptolyngbyaceae cyanobacterium CSU_1_3]
MGRSEQGTNLHFKPLQEARSPCLPGDFDRYSDPIWVARENACGILSHRASHPHPSFKPALGTLFSRWLLNQA